MDVRFVIVAPAKARKSFKVRLPVVVGRGDDVKFRIQQDSVSRRHCEFALDDGVVTVTDLGSTNGTLVAGKRIEPDAATAVPSGAEVRIGGTVLRVEYAATKAAAAPAAPHEADTVPLSEAKATAGELAGELDELEPAPDLETAAEAEAEAEAAAPEPAVSAADFPELPGADAAPPAGGFPAFPDVEPAAAPADIPAFPDVDAPPPPAEGSFDFLAGEAAPPPVDDDKLDDFFKSLS